MSGTNGTKKTAASSINLNKTFHLPLIDLFLGLFSVAIYIKAYIFLSKLTVGAVNVYIDEPVKINRNLWKQKISYWRHGS